MVITNSIDMKKIILLWTLVMLSGAGSLAQNSPSMEHWEKLLDKKELAEYFSGIFNSMGFIVEETGEQFTVHHQGDHFTMETGIQNDSVDYVVNLKLENISNMESHGDDSRIDDYESFRIMSVLFTPLTEASLTNPTLTKPLLRKMSGIENHIHVNLIAPGNTDTVSHTLLYVNKEWMVIPNKHGNAKRIFNLTPQEAVNYQRKVFIALQKNTMKGWKEFKKWYMEWRKNVSVEVAD